MGVPWKLGGRVIGDGLTDSVGQPIQVRGDVPCLNCGDAYSERELVDRRCFPCRYEWHLRTRRRLKIRPSLGEETRYPTDNVFEEVTIKKEREV